MEVKGMFDEHQTEEYVQNVTDMGTLFCETKTKPGTCCGETGPNSYRVLGSCFRPKDEKMRKERQLN